MSWHGGVRDKDMFRRMKWIEVSREICLLKTLSPIYYTLLAVAYIHESKYCVKDINTLYLMSVQQIYQKMDEKRTLEILS